MYAISVTKIAAYVKPIPTAMPTAETVHNVAAVVVP